ncbi:MAG: hypothetical protein ACRDH6_07460 [Actinomycetota bacterium]
MTNRVDVPSLPKPISYSDGDVALIRFPKHRPPTYLAIEAWRRIDNRAVPKGTPESLPFVLMPEVVQGRIEAWNALFVATRGWARYYIQASVAWPDEEGCSQQPDLGTQHVDWRFHLKTTRSSDR